MKTSLKRLFIPVILAVCGATSPGSTMAPFSLTLEAEENPVKAGSEVKVNIALQNSSNRAMYMSYGLSELDYSLEVRDIQNRVPPETDFARKSKTRTHFTNDQIFYLQPGESLPKALLVVSKYYDLSHPGKYIIRVSREVPKELGGGTVKSNTINVTVTE